jgi:hypothetical protein
MPSANVELRGGRIGVGQDLRFLDATGLGLTPGSTPISGAAAGSLFIGNAGSSLYSAAIAGQPYSDPTAPLFSARTLSIRVTDYALFQNTGTPGSNAGVVLGGTLTSPIAGAFQVSGPNPPDANGVALFGSINGATDDATALLGAGSISVIAVDRNNARINGCIVGSGGGGCLVSVVTQPALAVFDASRADLIRSADDLEIPFDPVVGTNNESLFSDVGGFDVPDDAAASPEKCPPGSSTPCKDK